MPTFFLFILLALSIVGQALQYGTADNDTLALTKRILEDMFGTGNGPLDKRTMEETAQPPAPPPAPPAPPAPSLHKRISLPLTYSKRDRHWYIEVKSTTIRVTFRFIIDTIEICTTAPVYKHEFDWVGEPGEIIECPSQPFWPTNTGYSGRERRGRIVFHDTLTWEGLLVSAAGYGCGSLGWALDDSRVPKSVHALPSLLAKFESPIFAMYLTHRPGKAKVDIGGVDDHVGPIEYHTVVKSGEDFQPWLIGSLRIYVGSNRIELDIKTKADTETQPPDTKAKQNIKTRTDTEAEPNPKAEPDIKTAFVSTERYLIGPPSQVAQIQARILADHSLVYFQWGDGGKKWPLRPVDSDHDPTSHWFWESYVESLKAGQPEMDRWYFGEPFWVDRCVVFDKNSLEPRVGIGEMPREESIAKKPTFKSRFKSIFKPSKPPKRSGYSSNV